MYVHGHGLDFICTCMHIYKLKATVHMYTTDLILCMLCIILVVVGFTFKGFTVQYSTMVQ